MEGEIDRQNKWPHLPHVELEQELLGQRVVCGRQNLRLKQRPLIALNVKLENVDPCMPKLPLRCCQGAPDKVATVAGVLPHVVWGRRRTLSRKMMSIDTSI